MLRQAFYGYIPKSLALDHYSSSTYNLLTCQLVNSKALSQLMPFKREESNVEETGKANPIGVLWAVVVF